MQAATMRRNANAIAQIPARARRRGRRSDRLADHGEMEQQAVAEPWRGAWPLSLLARGCGNFQGNAGPVRPGPSVTAGQARLRRWRPRGRQAGGSGRGRRSPLQWRADKPQTLEGYGGAPGRLTAVFHKIFEGIALGRIAAHAISDPAGIRTEDELLVRLDQPRMPGPTDLVLAAQGSARQALRLILDLRQDQAHRTAGRGNQLLEAGDRPHHRALERAGHNEELVGAIARQTQVMLDEQPEPLLLLLVA